MRGNLVFDLIFHSTCTFIKEKKILPRQAFHSGKYTCMLIFDLQKAFDTMNCDIYTSLKN